MANATLKLVTPVCETMYIHVFEPNTKFNADGVYSVDCVVDASNQEWKDLIGKIAAAYDSYYAAACQMAGKQLKRCPHMPWSTKDGKTIFKTKNNATGKNGKGEIFNISVPVLGPDGSPITKDSLQGLLGNGTMARVGFEVNLWNNASQGVGVTARLKLFQVVEPKFYSSFGGFKTAGGASFTELPKGAPLPSVPQAGQTAGRPSSLPIPQAGLNALAGQQEQSKFPSAIDEAFAAMGKSLAQ